MAQYSKTKLHSVIEVNNMNTLATDCYYRMKDLANIPERPARTHVYKSGTNKGKVRVIGARQASKGLIGVSEKTLWEWVKKGNFPQPIRLSPTITVWRASDIAQWMETKQVEGV